MQIEPFDSRTNSAVQCMSVCLLALVFCWESFSELIIWCFCIVVMDRVCSFIWSTRFVTLQTVVHGGRQCDDSFCSFAVVRSPHNAVNVIFREGTGSGYRCLAYTDHIQQTHCSWHLKVLLVKLKTLDPNFFLSGFAFRCSERNHTLYWTCAASNGLSDLSSSYNAQHTNCHVMTVGGLESEATYSLRLRISCV